MSCSELIFFAIRSIMVDTVILQFSRVFDISVSKITVNNTAYESIALLTLNVTVINTVKSIRNIEALQVNEATALALMKQIEGERFFKYTLLGNVAPS